MAINFELLSKVAKVYEAAEPVEGAKPKEVYESHKKCAPGEFGMNKEGGENEGDAAARMMAQAQAATSPKGLLTGSALGSLAGLLGGGAYGAYNPGSYATIDENGKPVVVRRSRLMGALRGGLGYGLGGAVAGGIAGGHVAKALGLKAHPVEKKSTVNKTGIATHKESAMAKPSAFEFGSHVKQALDPRLAAALNSAGVGGLAGAGLGGLYGLLNPGTEEDEDGNSRPKSRLMAALRGAAGGGLAGGLAGGAFGAAAPTQAADVGAKLRRLIADPTGSKAKEEAARKVNAAARAAETAGSPTMGGSIPSNYMASPSAGRFDNAVPSEAAALSATRGTYTPTPFNGPVDLHDSQGRQRLLANSR